VRKQPRLEVPQTEVVVDVVKKGVWKKEQETLRGLTMGSINMRHDERVRTGCVVVGDKFPCWLLHCGALGLEVVRVCLKSDEFITIIERRVLDTAIEAGDVPSSFPLASVVRVDGPASTNVLAGAWLSQAKFVLST
jgi:hypothetical protein